MSFQQWLTEARYPVVLTGAGMSTESGLPDFRSAANGLWKSKDPVKLASIQAMEHNREEFVSFYTERIKRIKECQPHVGHYILAKWEKEGRLKSVITQNVDGFHYLAGNEQVVELHGTLRHLHCECCERKANHNLYIHKHLSCDCGGFLRPSVVLFGEMLPYEAMVEANLAAKQADLFIVLGSSMSVSPANSLPMEAKRNGAKLVIVNLEETELDSFADEVIHHRKIGEVLQEVDGYM